MEANPLRAAQDEERFLELAGELRTRLKERGEGWYWPEADEVPAEDPLDEEQLRALEALGYTGDE